jgi:hypothetical protein
MTTHIILLVKFKFTYILVNKTNKIVQERTLKVKKKRPFRTRQNMNGPDLAKKDVMGQDRP